MRQLWQVTGMLAADDRGPLYKQLAAVAQRQDRPDLLNDVAISTNPAIGKLKVKAQASPLTLQKIDAILKPHGLHLSAYELAEVNRWVSEDVRTDGKTLNELFVYWKELGAVTGTENNRPEFLQALGVMSFDNEMRRQFLEGKGLKDFGFDLNPEDEAAVKAALFLGPADAAAARFARDTWSTPTCGGVMVAGAEWLHMNL